MPEARKERLALAVSMGSRRNEPLRMEPVRKDAGFVGHVKVVDESADLFFSSCVGPEPSERERLINGLGGLIY